MDGGAVEYPLELIDARTHFLIGNFQKCLKLLQQYKPTFDAHKLEKLVLTYRTFIGQKKYGLVLNEIPDCSDVSSSKKGGANESDDSDPLHSVALQSIRILAEYLSSSSSSAKQSAVAKMDALVSPSACSANQITALCMAASLQMIESRADSALKILHRGTATASMASPNDATGGGGGGAVLELCGLTVQALLQIQRVDLAEKEVRRMLHINEDDLHTQLAHALWLMATPTTTSSSSSSSSSSSTAKQLTEAFHIYQDLMDKYGATPPLLNCQASALIAQAKYQEAYPVLQQAMDLDANRADTLINMAVVSQHLDAKFDEVNRNLSQLRDLHRDHPFVVDLLAKEEEFDRCAASYTASVAQSEDVVMNAE